MREPTVFGIEKPFPWVLVGLLALIPVGLSAGFAAVVVALGLGYGGIDTHAHL